MTLTKQEEQVLRHMLGADSRYLKKQWGFRNHFCSGIGHSDQSCLENLEKRGLVVSNPMKKEQQFFFATEKGALAIGFKPYQLKKTEFPKTKGTKPT